MLDMHIFLDKPPRFISSFFEVLLIFIIFFMVLADILYLKGGFVFKESFFRKGPCIILLLVGIHKRHDVSYNNKYYCDNDEMKLPFKYSSRFAGGGGT